MNDTTRGDSIFVNGNSTIMANPILSYGDNPDASMHIYLAIRAILGITIMTFNGLLLYCICHFQYLRTATNTLVTSLCIANVLGGCEPFFGIATVYYFDQSTWVKLCLAGEVIKMFSVCGKMWSIVGVSIDSCLYICKPLKYHKWVTIECILKIIGIIWTYIITSATITLLKFNRLVIGMPCRTIIILDPVVYKILFYPQFTCLVTSLILCNSVIAVVAWQQKKRSTQQIAPTEAPNTNAAASDSTTCTADWAPSQYKDRLISVWRFLC